MRKNQSLFQAFLSRVHYKVVLAGICVLLGILSFSGFYFFGQNIVNESGDPQYVARTQFDDPEIGETNTSTQTDISVTLSPTQSESQTKDIGGISAPVVSVSPTEAITPTKTEVTPTASPSASPTQAPKLDASKFILGDPNTIQSIVAYYDFECVYCSDFVKDVLPQLVQEYVDTGKVKIIFKNYPLTNHTAASVAHNAAMCSSVKGDFWDFHEILFSKQKEWAGKPEQEVKTLMKSYFQSTGVKDSNYDACVDSNQYGTYVENDKNEGRSQGVTGAPTFIIGDKTLVGYQPIESFRAILDKK